MTQLADTWLGIESLLLQAYEELEDSNNVAVYTERGSRSLSGSPGEAMLFLKHNEFELAWDSLAQVGKHKVVPYSFWRHLLQAAEMMGLSDEKVNTSLRNVFAMQAQRLRTFPLRVLVYVDSAANKSMLYGLRQVFARRGILNAQVIYGPSVFRDDARWVVRIEVDAKAFLSWFFGEGNKSMRRFLNAIYGQDSHEADHEKTIKLRDTASRVEVVLYSSETPGIPESEFHRLLELDWLAFTEQPARLVYDKKQRQWINADHITSLKFN